MCHLWPVCGQNVARCGQQLIHNPESYFSTLNPKSYLNRHANLHTFHPKKNTIDKLPSFPKKSTKIATQFLCAMWYVEKFGTFRKINTLTSRLTRFWLSVLIFTFYIPIRVNVLIFSANPRPV